MAGLVPTQAPTAVQPQAAPQPSAAPIQLPPMSPLLKKIIAGIRAKVPPKLEVQYEQVVTAGMKVLFSPQTNHLLLQRINAPGPLYQKVANGVADLMLVLYKESKKKMSIPAAMLAMNELMCDILDVAERGQGVQLSPDIVAACTHATSMAVLKRFGIGQPAIQRAVALGHQHLAARTKKPAKAKG